MPVSTMPPDSGSASPTVIAERTPIKNSSTAKTIASASSRLLSSVSMRAPV